MAARKSPAEGRKGDKLWRDALMVAVKRECEDGGKTKKLAALADKLVERGLDGDVTALKEIGDTLRCRMVSSWPSRWGAVAVLEIDEVRPGLLQPQAGGAAAAARRQRP